MGRTNVDINESVRSESTAVIHLPKVSLGHRNFFRIITHSMKKQRESTSAYVY